MKLLNPRYSLALKMREDKKTFREIGEAIGCSPHRARQICEIAKHKSEIHKKRLEEGTETISTMAYNCLVRCGYKGATKSLIKEAIETGILGVRKTEYLGEKTFLKICEWAGATAPGPEKKMRTCPHCGRAFLA